MLSFSSQCLNIFGMKYQYQNLNEQIFGGLFQETLNCICGNVEEQPAQKFGEVIPIHMIGESVQTGNNKIFSEEQIERNCPQCLSSIAFKKMDIICEPSSLILQILRFV